MLMRLFHKGKGGRGRCTHCEGICKKRAMESGSILTSQGQRQKGRGSERMLFKCHKEKGLMQRPTQADRDQYDRLGQEGMEAALSSSSLSVLRHRHTVHFVRFSGAMVGCTAWC